MMSASHTPEETKAALHEVVTEMYDKIVKGEAPTMTLPVRTKNNIGFDSKLGVYKYGKSGQFGMRPASDQPSNCCVLCTWSSSSRK